MSSDESVLIFGWEPPEDVAVPVDTLSSRRVRAETIRANMVAALSGVRGMVEAANDALGDVQVAHMDVELAVGLDGSVGLLGSGVSSSVKGTVTIRIEPRA